jgi:hypothetical protein
MASNLACERLLAALRTLGLIKRLSTGPREVVVPENLIVLVIARGYCPGSSARLFDRDSGTEAGAEVRESRSNNLARDVESIREIGLYCLSGDGILIIL